MLVSWPIMITTFPNATLWISREGITRLSHGPHDFRKHLRTIFVWVGREKIWFKFSAKLWRTRQKQLRSRSRSYFKKLRSRSSQTSVRSFFCAFQNKNKLETLLLSISIITLKNAKVCFNWSYECYKGINFVWQKLGQNHEWAAKSFEIHIRGCKL